MQDAGLEDEVVSSDPCSVLSARSKPKHIRSVVHVLVHNLMFSFAAFLCHIWGTGRETRVVVGVLKTLTTPLLLLHVWRVCGRACVHVCVCIQVGEGYNINLTLMQHHIMPWCMCICRVQAMLGNYMAWLLPKAQLVPVVDPDNLHPDKAVVRVRHKLSCMHEHEWVHVGKLQAHLIRDCI